MRYKEMAIGQSYTVQRNDPQGPATGDPCSGSHINLPAHGIYTTAARVACTSCTCASDVAQKQFRRTLAKVLQHYGGTSSGSWSSVASLRGPRATYLFFVEWCAVEAATNAIFINPVFGDTAVDRS